MEKLDTNFTRTLFTMFKEISNENFERGLEIIKY